LNKTKEETLHITKGLVEEICREYNFYGLFVRYDGQLAFLERGPEPKLIFNSTNPQVIE
jgi:hypothetical protein